MGKHYLITGGAGFIGSNYAARLLARGEQVTILDNLSRAGAPLNLEWLRSTFGDDSFEMIKGDVRDPVVMKKVAAHADVVVHLAAQVAVTTSVTNPREDFEINALGTFNVLEAVRDAPTKPIMLFASTNKVYGGMDDVPVVEKSTRWEYDGLPFGAAETQPLDFHSPYGCSKGTGDQYVRDYARIYGLRTVVFRQSCIYGLRQFGIEDQGWVAWFVIAAITGRPISIYGDGKQVRDLLFVNDLVAAYDAAIDRIDVSAGQVFNIGGGRDNTISIWTEFAPMLEKLVGHPLEVKRSDWRPGDQRVYVSDIRKAGSVLSWTPKVTVEEGVKRLAEWVKENRDLF
jgi:CDP-paratose 2-epimerase